MLLLAADKIHLVTNYQISGVNNYEMCKRHCLMAYGCSVVATLIKVNKIAWKVTSGITVPGHQYEVVTYLA